ncbi:MAG: diguanylate cyclase [Mogibacterium sp.]|nr:diguanylate cyclase [Mogibacterium sp.]
MKSIRSKITLLIVIAVITSIAAIGLIGVYSIKSYGDETSDELLNLTCETRQQTLDTYLNSIEQSVDIVSRYATEEMTGFSDDEMESYLEKIEKLFRSVASNTNGVLTYYYRVSPDISDSREGFWYSKYDRVDFVESEITDLSKYEANDMEHVGWFYIPKEKGHAVWLEPYNNENLGGVKMISYVAPIYWKNHFIGVIGIDINYEMLRKQMEYIVSFENGYAFLVNEDDVIIYHSKIDSGTPVSEISPNLESGMLSAARPIVMFNYEGVRQRAAWSVLSNGMRLFVAAPETEIDAGWHKAINIMLLAATFILLLFLASGLITVGRIVKPLTHLTEAAKRIDEGDYDVELDYNGNDEVGILTGAFRQLVTHLKAYIGDLNNLAYKDALTSLRNKGAFDMYIRKMDDAIAAAPDGDKPEFAFCMFDCNRLKEINDTYGHSKGDVYLKTACRLICEVFRHSPVFRIGGDEFACILQNADYDNRVELCREFELRAMRISEAADKPWKAVDIASGIALYDPETDRSAYDVFKKADARMYEDKERKKAGIVSDLLADIISSEQGY